MRNACLYAFEYAEHLIMLEIGLYGMPDILYLTNSGSSSIVKNMQATALKKKKKCILWQFSFLLLTVHECIWHDGIHELG